MNVSIYIQGERLELFKDENIFINSSIQNIKDISKIFADFSQSFTIPASQRNNRIFKHWYKSELTNGFDARVRVDAKIELNSVPFKEGKIQLNSVAEKNNKVTHYDITFFGEVVKLTDLFGDDELTDLNLDAYIHEFNSDNVIEGLSTDTLLTADVRYPLISYSGIWTYDTSDATDIKNATTTKGALWYDFKPALRLQRIIDAIKTKYSITFSDDFFNSADFLKLYMVANKDKGRIKAFGEPELLSFGGQSNFFVPINPPSGWSQGKFLIDVTPSLTFEDVPYVLIMDVDGEQTQFPRTGTSGITTSISTSESHNVKWYLQASEPFDVTVDLELYSDNFVTLEESGSTGVISLSGMIYFSDKVVNGVLQVGQLPKMKVVDFIKGIVKAFNLIVQPLSSNSFKIQTLDDWYNNGEVKDFSRYADVEQIKLTRPEINKMLKFSYKEPSTILQDDFENRNNRYYGDLDYETEYNGGELDISLPFENLVFSNFSDSSGLITNINYAFALNDELEEVKTKPLIMYYRGEVTPTASLGVWNDSGVTEEVTTYNAFGQENGVDDSTITRSLNWGAEVSTYTLTVQSNSLFNDYWSTYISNLYDVRRRETMITAYLPPIKLSQLQLSDKIVIKNRRYIINNYKANLITGKVEFELLNDLNALPTIEINNDGLQYELQTGITG